VLLDVHVNMLLRCTSTMLSRAFKQLAWHNAYFRVFLTVGTLCTSCNCIMAIASVVFTIDGEEVQRFSSYGQVAPRAPAQPEPGSDADKFSFEYSGRHDDGDLLSPRSGGAHETGLNAILVSFSSKACMIVLCSLQPLPIALQYSCCSTICTVLVLTIALLLSIATAVCEGREQ
jgi:hypothetical protein